MTQTLGSTITVIPGDGIGPEVISAACRIADATGLSLKWEYCTAGAKAFAKGITTGVPQETLDSIERNKILFKGPLETPIGFGGKSANVTLRTSFETFGNIRPIKEISGVTTPFSGRNIDLVVVRENIEDVYAGIEHMQTPSVAQCLKLITEKGCEKIIRLAFELAVAEGRSLIHCATKANIMKMTEGMMKRVFERISLEYPDITAKHIIIDNCAHQMVMRPEQFNVIVTTNLNGDILSDLCAGLIGGLGLAPSANIGNTVSMFEAVHGSAPDIAGKDLANPTSVILSLCMMLRHLEAFKEANTIHNALLYTIEQGKNLTADIAQGKPSAGTQVFTDTIIQNFGKLPSHPVNPAVKKINIARCHTIRSPEEPTVELLGVDVFLRYNGPTEALAKTVQSLLPGSPFSLKMISNRGAQVYPSHAQTDNVDAFRVRLLLKQDARWTDAALFKFLDALPPSLPWIHIEKLHSFDGKIGYSLAQGES